jgi:hypothetical protein
LDLASYLDNKPHTWQYLILLRKLVTGGLGVHSLSFRLRHLQRSMGSPRILNVQMSIGVLRFQNEALLYRLSKDFMISSQTCYTNIRSL